MSQHTIKAIEETVASSEPTRIESSGRGRGRILVVDDEELVRKVTRLMLEKSGLSVSTASSGFEAIEVFARDTQKFSCVLLDLTMPQMDGQECLRQLRELDDTVPIVIMSGYNEHEVNRRFMNSGFAGFIHKPFTGTDLQQNIQSVLVEVPVSDEISYAPTSEPE